MVALLKNPSWLEAFGLLFDLAARELIANRWGFPVCTEEFQTFYVLSKRISQGGDVRTGGGIPITHMPYCGFGSGSSSPPP